MERSKTISCYLEFRSEGKKPLDFSDGGMQIKFCPWCGTDLNQQYGTPVTVGEEKRAQKS
jgi:hypothetical protein